jgi:CubicO group peptidase (beta-lactamase class C family)
MKRLPREAPPGTKWVYKTGETNLIGVLVSRAVKMSLAQYLQHKIWIPYGMEREAAWVHDASDQDVGGCCLSVTLRDYARMGQFVLEGGHGVVPPWWYAMAGTKQADIGAPGFGYGYQWWTRDDGTFDARGIFGQMIHIDPKRELVVVINSDWDTAVGAARSQAREAFLKAVIAAVDAAPEPIPQEPQPVGPQATLH